MWVDKPFFDLIGQMSSLLPYFITQAWFIGKIIMTLNIGFLALNHAAKGSGLSDGLIKLGMAFVIFSILMNSYPAIISGINNIVFQWAFNSTYTTTVSDMIDQTRDNFDFWDKKKAPAAGGEVSPDYSEIIKVVQVELGDGNIGEKYVLDVFDPDTGFIRPSSILRLLMLCFDNLMNKANKSFSIWKPGSSLGTWILMLITALVLIFCGIFAALQYFICAIEFILITAVGVILLPCMMWDGTKFMAEKLIGAIFGFAVKMLFVSIGMLLAINGYLALLVRPFDGAIDQIVYTIFVSLFYMMICQSGPQLAVSLLTGTPQMSLMEGVKAAGAYAAAGIAGAHLTQKAVSKGAQGAVRAKGAATQAQAAAGAVKQLGGSAANVMGAVGASLGSSAANSVKSTAHSIGRSLLSGGKNTSSGGAGTAGNNPFSQTTTLNKNDADGNRRRVFGKNKDSYMDERRKEGAELGLNYMIKKEDKAASAAEPKGKFPLEPVKVPQSDWKAPYKTAPKDAGYYPEGSLAEPSPYIKPLPQSDSRMEKKDGNNKEDM